MRRVYGALLVAMLVVYRVAGHACGMTIEHMA